MKKLVIILGVALVSVATYAQGTVTFANAGAGFTRPVVDVNGTPLAGSTFVAQLYAGATSGSLVPVGATTPFLVNGFFNGGVRTVTDVAPGASAFFQVAAWEAAAGSDWQEAYNSGGQATISAEFSNLTGGVGTPPTPPGALSNMPAGMQLEVIPEPSTFALLALGAAAMLLRRRK